jgi:hypothetical protein
VSLSYHVPFAAQYDGTVFVDDTDTVAEINETNNTSATHFNSFPATLNAQKVSQPGFGDPRNTFAWSMAWFKGKLYVGTQRSSFCFESWTYDYFFPEEGFYNGPGDSLPEANCPDDRYDLDLRAEIWQYTPETNVWKRVYQSPTIPNPQAPGKPIARDIGYRGMVVYTDANGQQALYVGGVTADEVIPEIAADFPPRILRSVDGETFAPLPTGPGLIHNTFGAQRPIGFRAMAVYDGRLFATASGGLTGDGVIFEVRNPSGPSPEFVQVSPDTMQVYEMEVFNGTLYIGNGGTGGYSVWKLTNQSTTPFGFSPIVTGGAGRTGVTSVVSMQVFKGRLYVGANGWGPTQLPAAEEIRINPDDTWDLVVGAARTLPDGTTKSSLSGLHDGFGNWFNVHMWRAEVHNGALYIGTNDSSSAFHADPNLGPALRFEYGFDVWGTCDGQYWWSVTRNAFGDGQWNFGARTIVSSPFGAFIGSTNHIQGTSVWKGDASPCGSGAGSTFGPLERDAAPSRSAASAPVGSLRPPTRLLTAVQACGTALSWDRVPGATRYRILRADYHAVDTKLTPKMLVGISPDLPRFSPKTGSSASRHQRVWIAGRSRPIGTSTKTSFVDRSAKPGGRYNYTVVAVGPSGTSSQPSNVATVPSPTPTATFSEVKAAVRRLTASASRSHRPERANASKLLGLVASAQARWRQGEPAASVEILVKLRIAADAQADNGRASESAALKDVKDAIFELERRAILAAACKA